MKYKLFDNPDWTEESLKEIWKVIKDIAINEFKLDFYEPYFEIVTFEEMLHIYTTGFPVMYNHWEFGRSYEDLYRQYKNNRMSIAYEVIFNTDPALCYLLETNSSVMQALVMSHAAIGHSAFFKMNSFIRENTNAKNILCFLKNMRKFVEECESKYGIQRVEEILDVCKSFSNYSIDRAEKPIYTTKQKEQQKLKRLESKEKDFDILVEDFKDLNIKDSKKMYRENEENILKFISKFSPSLKLWERELINMFCKVEQYFYPQRLTKTMNEGFASFWHYEIMNRLVELDYLKPGDFIEFLHSHTGVTNQPGMEEAGYRGFNPYKMGFELFSEIKRICQNPTKEDELTHPQLIGKNWIEEVNYAAINFRDSSFIQQYLTPKLVRDFKLLKVNSRDENSYIEITGTHEDEDFKEIRKAVEGSYNYFGLIPYITIQGASLKGTRTLFVNVVEKYNRQVDVESLSRSLDMLKKLWPFPICMKYRSFFGKEYVANL
jgi:spore cortex formation protein SpoVR/YcgB (stage V sporulation)